MRFIMSEVKLGLNLGRKYFGTSYLSACAAIPVEKLRIKFHSPCLFVRLFSRNRFRLQLRCMQGISLVNIIHSDFHSSVCNPLLKCQIPSSQIFASSLFISRHLLFVKVGSRKNFFHRKFVTSRYWTTFSSNTTTNIFYPGKTFYIHISYKQDSFEHTSRLSTYARTRYKGIFSRSGLCVR